MSDQNLDRRLREFLETDERERQRGHTLANVILRIEQLHTEHMLLASQVASNTTNIAATTHRLDRHGRAIRDIKLRLDWSQDDVMDTGTHNIEDLQRALAEKEREKAQNELKEHKENSQWWRRQGAQWIVAALGAIVLTAIMTTLGILSFFLQRTITNNGNGNGTPPAVVQPK